MTSAQDRSRWATGRLLSTAARLTEQAWNARLRASGVTHAGLIVLNVLTKGAASQRELAQSQFLTEQTIGRTLTHLESTGHVGRAIDPTDRRRRVVEITPAGRRLVETMTDTEGQITDVVLAAAGLAPAEFRSGLQALIDSLDTQDETDWPTRTDGR